jgi:S1-C subfamily serine protease
LPASPKTGPRPWRACGKGDLILAIDDQPTPTVDAVHKLLDRHTIGRTLTLRVLRAGKILDAQATVSGRPDDKPPR